MDIAELSPAAIGIGIFVSLLVAAAVGLALHVVRFRYWPATPEELGRQQTEQGYLVSGTLLLLGLLMAFTLSVSLDRFEHRRLLVVSEANAIGTAYLRSQILDEPHRERLSRLLVAYTDNRIRLGGGGGDRAFLLARNDRLLTHIWAAVTAATPSATEKGITTPFLNTFNEVIDLDTERKVARQAKVPEAVLVTLYIFLIATAGVLGNVLGGTFQRLTGVFLLMLLTLTTGVIVDLNRPISGWIRESQQPLVMLQASLLREPRTAFDRFR